jgi:hypothetical protein
MNSKVLATRIVTGPGGGVGILRIHAARQRVGSTNPNFAPPAGLDSNSMGAGLSAALQTLLSTYSSNGVPSEHAYDATAAAFQQIWNNDPIVSAAGGNALLSVDGGYGPNTALAVATINGGSAPSVNPSPAPPGTPPAAPVPSPSPAPASALAGMSTWGLWLVGAAAVGGAYLIGKSAMEQHGGKVLGHARRAHAQLRHHARRLSRRH